MSKAPLDPTTGRRRPGRPPRLDVDRIADAALAEIDGLSVAAVARRLGVSQGSLYHHVDGIADLVRLAADRSLADVEPVPADVTADRVLEDLALSLLTRLRAHPGLDDALLTQTAAPPRLLAVMTDIVERLVAHGATAESATDAVGIVSQIAHTLERQRRMVDGDPDETDAVLRRRIRLVVRGLGVEPSPR